MWNWHWQSIWDYGRRYDVGFFEWHSRAYGAFRLYNQHMPAKGWIVSDLRHQLVEYPVPGGKLLAVIKRGQWTYGNDTKVIEGPEGEWQLTRGTMAACWAMTKAKPGDAFVLVGFDNVREAVCLPVESGFAPEYRNDPGTFSFNGYQPGASRYGYHDFEAERRLLAAMADKYQVRVDFAQDYWQ
jgi:hypothetical protein